MAAWLMQLLRLAPELALHAGHAGQVLQGGIARIALLRRFDARQPGAVQAVQPGLQRAAPASPSSHRPARACCSHTGSNQSRARCASPPNAVRRCAAWIASSGIWRSAGSSESQARCNWATSCAPLSRSIASPRTMLWAAPARKRPVLGQQACRLQRLRGVVRQPGRLELHAQCQRAAGGALRQALEPGHRGIGLAVVQRPARGAHQGALVRLLGVARRSLLQRLLQVLLARSACPAAPARFRRPAGAPACAPAPRWPAARPPPLSDFSCPSAASADLRARMKRPASRCEIASSSEPCMARSFCCVRQRKRLARQVEQRRQRAQCGMQEHESREQQQQHQVERQVHPVRRPEHRDGALVVAREQRDGDGDAEQGQEPERGAHQRSGAAA